MPLRLSAEDQAEYDRRCSENTAIKMKAMAAGDHALARKMRQANTRLYQEYELKQIPPPPPTEYEIEERMTVEQRLDRIEEHLKIGRYEDGY